MSMNIYISGTREVKVIKTGQIINQTLKFAAYQTPTEVTYKILESADPGQAYKDWVLELGDDVVVPVYADHDIFHEEAPIGSKIENYYKDHVKEFDEWVDNSIKNGYTIDFEQI